MKSYFLISLAIGLFSPFILAQEIIRVPSSIDVRRLDRIDKEFDDTRNKDSKSYEHRLKVFAQMTAIEPGDAKLLFPAHIGTGMGNAEQLRTRFETAISSTNRFQFHSTRQTDVGEGIVVEGMITRTAQNIEDYKAFYKSVTRVDMSVQIKTMDDGEMLRSKNFSVVYGADPAEGTVFDNKKALKATKHGECEDPVVCSNLQNDYGHALRYLLDEVAGFIEKTFRPIARVYDVDGGNVTMFGGINHGFVPEEELVVFRARKIKGQGGKPLPPALKGIAIVKCSVGDMSMNCEVTKKGGEVEPGDYAIPSNRMLKFQERNG